MRVQLLDKDECLAGGQQVRGQLVLSREEAVATDAVHFVVRGQEFSLIYYQDEEQNWQAAAQAHVFYEKSYDYRVRRQTSSEEDEILIPFALPLPEALPSTALLHLTTSDNFCRIQYKLQVFRTGRDVDASQISFDVMAGSLRGGQPNLVEQQSNNVPEVVNRDRSIDSNSTNTSVLQRLEPIPQKERLRELYVHHTRASPDATPLLIRAPAWNSQHQATTHLHVQVVERVQMVRSAFCGLYDYTTTTFRLLTQPSTLHVTPGKEIRLILTDPDNFLRTWIDRKTKFGLVGKVTQTIQWYTSRRFVAYPIHKTWDLPEISFDVEPLTEETKDGIFDEHILLDRAVNFPKQPAETFEGFMLSIKSSLMLGLRMVDPSGEKRAAGATPNMPLQVRGGGGLALNTKEADRVALLG